MGGRAVVPLESMMRILSVLSLLLLATACDKTEDDDGDGWDSDSDCNDHDASVHPGAAEYCDGKDNDCDGTTDEADAVDAKLWYYDGDHDTFGDPTVKTKACDAPANYVADNTDCDDGLASINPDATEVCDAYDVDEDCDGSADDDDPSATGKTVYYPDTDHDSFGDETSSGTLYCDAPAHWVLDNTDCDDGEDAAYPGADEVWYDDIDEACDGGSDWDQDGDGYDHPTIDCEDLDASVYPGAPEIRDGLDNNCDNDCDEGLLSPGDLVITEFMADPFAVSGSHGEWFEIYNTTGIDIGICNHWDISDDDGEFHVITEHLMVPAGDFLVLGIDDDTSTNGGAPVDYEYSGITLAADADTIALTFDGDVIDEVAYDFDAVDEDDNATWGTLERDGYSLQVDPTDYSSNDEHTDYCNPWGGTFSTYGDGDHGTPGAENDECPTGG